MTTLESVYFYSHACVHTLPSTLPPSTLTSLWWQNQFKLNILWKVDGYKFNSYQLVRAVLLQVSALFVQFATFMPGPLMLIKVSIEKRKPLHRFFVCLSKPCLTFTLVLFLFCLKSEKHREEAISQHRAARICQRLSSILGDCNLLLLLVQTRFTPVLA